MKRSRFSDEEIANALRPPMRCGRQCQGLAIVPSPGRLRGVKPRSVHNAALLRK
ncbi:MAG: hypothetical protein ACK52I_11905 [Pseudomonadota bacterium]